MPKIPTCKSPKDKLGGLHYTTEHCGKMYGLWSLSTSCLCNPLCVERFNSDNKDSVCTHCFSVLQQTYYKNMVATFQKNYEILNSRILDDNEIPYITNPLKMFRSESFGDFGSWLAVANLFKIAYKNPDVMIGAWTKNPHFVQEAIDNGYKKPKNVQIVLSSMFLNVPTKLHERFAFVDKVFTVYTKEYVAEHGIDINCGSKSCATCGRCYNKNKRGQKVQYVNEILKKIY